jgi:hypothetical protein
LHSSRTTARIVDKFDKFAIGILARISTDLFQKSWHVFSHHKTTTFPPAKNHDFASKNQRKTPIFLISLKNATRKITN